MKEELTVKAALACLSAEAGGSVALSENKALVTRAHATLCAHYAPPLLVKQV